MDKEKITVDMVWFVASGLFLSIAVGMIIYGILISIEMNDLENGWSNRFEVESSKFPRSIDTGNCRFGCVHVHDWMYIDCVNTGNMSYLNYTCEYCFKINEN